jgi:hypothetical protein
MLAFIGNGGFESTVEEIKGRKGGDKCCHGSSGMTM